MSADDIQAMESSLGAEGTLAVLLRERERGGGRERERERGVVV